MSGFIDKLKELLKREILQEGKGLGHETGRQLPTKAAQAVGHRGNTESAGSRGGSARAMGDPTRDQASVETADSVTQQYMGELLSDLEKGDEFEETSESGWKSEVFEYEFPSLSKAVGSTVKMTLTRQTGEFLRSLFDSLFANIENATATFNVVGKDTDRNVANQMNIKDVINDISDVDFKENCDSFLSFLQEDGRLYPDNYIVSVTIPMAGYKEEAVKEICNMFNISSYGTGITYDEVPKVITMRFRISSNSTLLNLYNTKDVFRVGSNHGSLEKFSWMAKQLRNIYRRNLSSSNNPDIKKITTELRDIATQLQREKDTKKKSALETRQKELKKEKSNLENINDEFLRSTYVNSVDTNSVSLSPLNILAKAYNSYVTNQHDIYCFLDEVEGSFIYVPGSKGKQDEIYDLSYDEEGPVGNLYQAIEKFVEGLTTQKEFQEACKEAIGDSGFQQDMRYAELDDKILNFLNTEFDPKKPLKIQATKDDTDPENPVFGTNYNDVIVKPLEALISSSASADERKRYDKIVDIVKSAEPRMVSVGNDKTKIINIGKELISSVSDTLGESVTSNKMVRDIMTMLTENFYRVHVFRFMYKDRVDLSYEINLPSKTATELLKMSKIDPAKVPLGFAVPQGDVSVPGAEDLPRKKTFLTKRVTVGDPSDPVKNVNYKLVTMVDDLIKSPAGSMYGMKYTSASKVVPEEFRAASHIMNLFEMRTLLGKIIEMYYFEPKPEELAALKNGNPIDRDGIKYFPDSPNVKIALDNLRSGDAKTLIKRIRNSNIIRENYGVVVDDKYRSFTNDEMVDIVFSDYYDAVVNMRQQLEIFMKNLHLDDAIESATSKQSSALRETGNPTMVSRILKGIVNGAKSSSTHSDVYSKIASDEMVSSHLEGVFSAYIKYLSEKRGKQIGEKKFVVKKPTVILQDFTPTKNVNFAGDRIFVNGDRNSWLNGKVGAIIPFYDRYLDGTLFDDIKGQFLTTSDSNKELLKVVKAYYAKTCELCDVIKNFEKLQLSDGCRARQYTKKNPSRGAAWASVIRTGLPASVFGEGTEKAAYHVDTGDAGAYQKSRNAAKVDATEQATAADINAGCIGSRCIHTYFLPIFNAIKRTISENKEKLNGVIPAIDATNTKAVVPLCPYNTIVFATEENGELVINIDSSTIRIGQKNGTSSLDNSAGIQFDSEDRFFRFSEEAMQNMTEDQKEKVLSEMAKRDAVYCMAHMFTKNYFLSAVDDAYQQYKDASVRLFNSICEQIANINKDPGESTKDWYTEAKNAYMENRAMTAGFSDVNPANALTKFFVDKIKEHPDAMDEIGKLVNDWLIFVNMKDVMSTR